VEIATGSLLLEWIQSKNIHPPVRLCFSDKELKYQVKMIPAFFVKLNGTIFLGLCPFVFEYSGFCFHEVIYNFHPKYQLAQKANQ
jgi:hypothetical protein